MVEASSSTSPNSKKLQQATWVDILLSLILPFWGIIVGLIALIKGEFKRGLTMIIISIIIVVAFVMIKS